MNIKIPAQVEAHSGRLIPLPKSRAKPRDLQSLNGAPSGNVESGPPVRSSYHAHEQADGVKAGP
jgi:hypothetical protein